MASQDCRHHPTFQDLVYTLDSLLDEPDALQSYLEALERRPSSRALLVVFEEASDLIKRALEIRPDVPVLFMSGFTDDTLLHHGLDTARCELIEKPFTPAAIRARIRALLDAPSDASQSDPSRSEPSRSDAAPSDTDGDVPSA